MPGPWDAALIVAKALGYAGALGAAGAVFFIAYAGALLAPEERGRIWRQVRNLALLSVAAGAGQLLLMAASMSGDAAGLVNLPLLRMALQSGAGGALALRAGGLLAAVGCAAAPRRATAITAACIAAAVAPVSFAWVGHAHALRPDAVPQTLLGLHLLCAAFWTGALGPLLIVSRSGDTARMAAAAARFGRAAVAVVAMLAAAGALLLSLMLEHFSDLWQSGYGRFILLKLSVVAALVALAAFNRLSVTPRLLAGDAHAVDTLRITIRCEMALAVLILAVTAVFTSLEGPPALDGGNAAMRGGNRTTIGGAIQQRHRGVTCEQHWSWARF